MFEIFANLASAAVKMALTPVAVVKDVANVVTGEDPDATKNLMESAAEDVGDAINEATGG